MVAEDREVVDLFSTKEGHRTGGNTRKCSSIYLQGPEVLLWRVRPLPVLWAQIWKCFCCIHLILSDCLDFTWLGLLYTLNRLASTPSPMKVEFAFAAASFSGSAGANSNT